MATTIDWPSGVISVPRADMTLIQSSPFEVRELDLDTFRRDLRALEEGEDGRPFPITHDFEDVDTLSGTTFASKVKIRAGYYSVTFEDGQYAVNLDGANSNVGDVVNLNQVSVRSFNSAGLVQVATGSGLSGAQDTRLTEIHRELNLEDGTPITRTKSGSTITETGGGFTVTHTGADTDTVVSTRS